MDSFSNQKIFKLTILFELVLELVLELAHELAHELELELVSLLHYYI